MNDPVTATEAAPRGSWQQFAPTRLLFREDAYKTEAEARVIGIVDGLIVLDASLFYAASGGQPSDFGTIARGEEPPIAVAELRYLDPAKTRIAAVLPYPAGEDWVGARIVQKLDFARRYRLMRMHSALHLLSVVLKYPVTGGAIGPEEGRLDFDIPDAGLEKEAIGEALNQLIAKDAAISDRMISEAELDANPGLVKTLSVQPPRGTGSIRLVEIEGLDLQPCGGTHVRRTGEIGPMRVTNIEKKGRQNRRVRIAFAEPGP